MHIAVKRFLPYFLTIRSEKYKSNFFYKYFDLTKRWIKYELDKLITNLNKINENMKINEINGS